MKKNISVLLVSTLMLTLLIACGKKEDKPAEAPAATPSAVATNGKEIYANNGCNSCHGDTGLGDGAAAAALNPKPRNFKSPEGEWKNGKNVEGIVKTLKNGIAPGMAAYAYINDEDMAAVANYILELGQ